MAEAGAETQAGAAADEILRSEARLTRWTKMTAQCWALYEGANRSLVWKGGAPAARALIGAYRTESALMAVVRLTALYDKDRKNVSFQTVFHQLKLRDVQDEVVNRYAKNANGWLSPNLETECRKYIVTYIEAYSRIDWISYGHLQRLRNLDIAHITVRAFERKGTANQLFALLVIAMELQNALSLMVSGIHTDLQLKTEEDIEDNRRVLLALLKVERIGSVEDEI